MAGLMTRIATRKSPLALWQAEHVRQKLQEAHPGLNIELIGMQTQGDRFLDAPLAYAGGKGLFIKELEQALLADQADIAVHSMKDVTIDLPEQLELAVILAREDARDVFISNHYACLDALPEAARVGTSSVRRQSQLRHRRPDLTIIDLRGNVGTRLRRLDAGEYDAIILAAAGIRRLGLSDRITQTLEQDVLLPAIGQGAIGIECRKGDVTTLDLIRPLNNRDTQLCVHAERAFSGRLYGGCQLPIAAHATINGQKLSLTGLVGRIDGTEIIRDTAQGMTDHIEETGRGLAERLLSRGADKILNEIIR
ncbi:MAG: hydroxymethylbilane synthase [Gammaproteobacteria bacterium RBG_16_51_14]|nr:MAG: hydroxymethylbilane synthase [Gammaproteobacteria bacterium RBG_16_51_14]